MIWRDLAGTPIGCIRSRSLRSVMLNFILVAFGSNAFLWKAPLAILTLKFYFCYNQIVLLHNINSTQELEPCICKASSLSRGVRKEHYDSRNNGTFGKGRGHRGRWFRAGSRYRSDCIKSHGKHWPQSGKRGQIVCAASLGHGFRRSYSHLRACSYLYFIKFPFSLHAL